MSPIRAVWFDVGEVLINETREYGTRADWLGIHDTPSRRCSAQSSLAARTTAKCSYFRPDFDLRWEAEPLIGRRLSTHQPASPHPRATRRSSQPRDQLTKLAVPRCWRDIS
jgi:hypothetical protein